MNENHKLTDFLDSFKKEAFLQSESWRKFQESVGKKTFHIEDLCKVEGEEKKFCIWANIISHELPIVGKYFYIPRGPILIGRKDKNILRIGDVKKTLDYLFWLAKDNGAGWIRFDARSGKDLTLLQEALGKTCGKKEGSCITKAPHDMQPKEIFVMDVSKPEERLLAEMKSKTRYNVRLAEKRGVVIRRWSSVVDKKKHVGEFLRLNRETAARDGIVTHPDGYYVKMLENLPEDMISLYTAEYEGKTIVANLVIFFEDTAVYTHGASSNEHRDVMAPYLMQWMQIQDAKGRGCRYYDFGGVKSKNSGSWEGITRFKTGFSTKTEPIVFPGSYDIIINHRKYSLYKGLQKAKGFLRRIRK